MWLWGASNVVCPCRDSGTSSANCSSSFKFMRASIKIKKKNLDMYQAYKEKCDRSSSGTSLAVYGSLVSPQRKWTPKSFSEIQVLYSKAAVESGLWNFLYSKGLIYDFGLGTVENTTTPFMRPPSRRFVVDALANEAETMWTYRYETGRVDRGAFVKLFGDYLCAQGMYTIPLHLRCTMRLRSVVPSRGDSTYDGVPYGQIPQRGLLDPSGYLEIATSGSPMGSPSLIKNLNLHTRSIPGNPAGAQQILWSYSGKGSNVALRCDPAKTVVGLNKIDAAVRLLERMQDISRHEAIVYFVEKVCNQREDDPASEHGLDSWATYVTRFIDVKDPSSGQGNYLVLGNHGSPTMWESVAANTSLRSLTHPQRPFDEYSMSDVAQIFVQVSCTPDFMVKVSDRWAQLAALQHFYLAPYADAVIGTALGRFGTGEGEADLVQCLFEYRGDTFHAMNCYAWWRYVSYTNETWNEKRLTDLPPPASRNVSSVTGPFYVRNTDGSWRGKSVLTSFSPSLDQTPSSYTPSSLGEVQINVNYFMYVLSQMLFPSAPLCPDNVNGGRWPFLGIYDVSVGKIVNLTTGISGPPLGYLFPDIIKLGHGLPRSIPKTIGASGVPFLNCYFVITGVQSSTTNPNAHDANAPVTPAGGMKNTDWIYFDGVTDTWTYKSNWPLQSSAVLDKDTDSVTSVANLWDRTIPPTMVGHSSPYVMVG